MILPDEQCPEKWWNLVHKRVHAHSRVKQEMYLKIIKHYQKDISIPGPDHFRYYFVFK